MPHSVVDVGSNLDENLQRWSRSLARGGEKLKVFKVVYSSKQKQWTASQISQKLSGDIEPYDVPNIGKKLVGDGLLHQVPNSWPVVYTKILDVQHYKNRILGLAKNSAKREGLATKRTPKTNVRINVTSRAEKLGRTIEITIDNIDQFQRVRRRKAKLPNLRPLSEAKFKRGLLKLLGERGKFADSGIERDDFITSRLKIKGRRHTAAFALKGPGLRAKRMTLAKWGKRGNQIQKLVSAPADVFVLQAEKQFDEDSLEQLQNLVGHKAFQQRRTLYYGHIDRTDSLRLRRAYPEFF